MIGPILNGESGLGCTKLFSLVKYTKQLLDEVEHDSENYQGRGG